MSVWSDEVEGLYVQNAEDLARIEQIPFERLTEARSVYELLQRHAAEHPDWPAIVFMATGDPDGPSVTLSYGDLFRQVTQSANLFEALSGGQPPVVASMLPVLPQAHVALWGGAAAGVAMPLNFLLGTKDLAGLLNAAKATVLVALGPHPGLDIWEKALAVREQVPTLRAILQVGGEVDGSLEGVQGYDAAVAAQRGDRLLSGRSFALDDIAAYFHTGGTTGLPKLARHANGNHLAMAFAVGRSWGFRPQEGVMNGLPIFHVGGALDLGLAVLGAGGFTLLVTPAGLRNPQVVQNVWRIAEKFRLGVVGGVPTSILSMLQVPVGDADISSVKIAITGGSPLPPEPTRAFEETFGLTLHEVYGMTETCGNAAVTPRESRRVQGSAGLRTPYTEVRVVRVQDDGSFGPDCAPGEPGVILLRGPTVTPGYTDPRLNEGVLLDGGWLVTGDLGRLEGDRLFITGRAKDLIIRSGHNLDPALIEEAIEDHPAVLHTAAVGLPDEYAGELPMLFVELAPGAAATPEELLAWVEERIAERPAMPKEIRIVQQMPLTAVGKIFKPALRAMLVQDVYADRLADVARRHGVQIAVEAVIEPGAGIVATVRVEGPANAREPVGAEVSERLADFSLYSYRLSWEGD